MNFRDKDALQRWEQERLNLIRETPVPKETEQEKRKRIAILENDPEKWFAFYFTKYYTAEPAPFHVRSSKKLIYTKRIYMVRRWSRELAKSTRGMMEDLMMAMTGKASVFLLVSHSYDNAEELLMPYMLNLESNPRLINDYGKQRGVRNWTNGKFATTNGVSFRALGAGQSPRGTKNDEKRPDVIRIDDMDTDEQSRSEKRVKENWAWVEQALIPTVSVSGNVRIVFQGNLISKNSIIARASEMADIVETINIRDKYGKSTWPTKNTEEHIDWLLSKMSYISIQKEYYNNPIVEGTVFKEMHFKKMPKLTSYKFLVAYGDPSFKESRKNDFKAVVLMGKIKDEYHVIKAFVDQNTTAAMADWYHEIHKLVHGQVPVYYFIEANATQDLIFELVKKHIRDNNLGFSLVGDYRAKGDKFSRIESALEPINRNGQLYLNEEEKDNPGMQVLKDQFLAIDPQLSGHDDGPDAVEGGKHILDIKQVASVGITMGLRGAGTYKNKKRF